MDTLFRVLRFRTLRITSRLKALRGQPRLAAELNDIAVLF